MAPSPFHSRLAQRVLIGALVLIAVLSAALSYWKRGEAPKANEDAIESTQETASAQTEERVPNRSIATEETGSREATREKTFQKFSDLYGKQSPLIEPLFEWAILGFRADRGSPDFVEERKKVLAQLNRDPSATLSLLASGQRNFPADWGAVRNSLVNLVGQLDLPNRDKAEFLSAEILRAPRLTDEEGEADADSFALATAIDYLSRVGSDSDARKVLEAIRGSRDHLSKDQLEYILTRMQAYFPEVTTPFAQELLGHSLPN